MFTLEELNENNPVYHFINDSLYKGHAPIPEMELLPYEKRFSSCSKTYYYLIHLPQPANINVQIPINSVDRNLVVSSVHLSVFQGWDSENKNAYLAPVHLTIIFNDNSQDRCKMHYFYHVEFDENNVPYWSLSEVSFFEEPFPDTSDLRYTRSNQQNWRLSNNIPESVVSIQSGYEEQLNSLLQSQFALCQEKFHSFEESLESLGGYLESLRNLEWSEHKADDLRRRYEDMSQHTQSFVRYSLGLKRYDVIIRDNFACSLIEGFIEQRSKENIGKLCIEGPLSGLYFSGESSEESTPVAEDEIQRELSAKPEDDSPDEVLVCDLTELEEGMTSMELQAEPGSQPDNTDEQQCENTQQERISRRRNKKSNKKPHKNRG